MSELPARKVRFQGEVYWFLPDENESGPLAPLDQCDDHGALHPMDALFGMSYAHVFENGEIKRFNVVIGTRADLESAP